MKAVIDTNVLVSALLSRSSGPFEVLNLWRCGRFRLLTAGLQIDELVRVTRYPKLRARLNPALTGRLVNELRSAAIVVDPLPPVNVSPDPYDNYLLAIAEGGQADVLITGDKRDLLFLGKHGRTLITTVSDFLAGNGRRHRHDHRPGRR